MVRRFFALSALCLSFLLAFSPVSAAVDAARSSYSSARNFVSAILATVFAPEPFRFRDGNPRSIFETRRLGLC